MKPKNCSFCRGTLTKGFAELITRLQEKLLVISKIPACICDNSPNIKGV